MTRPNKLAKTSVKPFEGASVQLLSTISRAPVVDSDTEPVVKQKEHLLDPRFELLNLFDLTPPSNKSVYYGTQEHCSP